MYRLPTFNRLVTIQTPAWGANPAVTQVDVPCQIKGLPRLFEPIGEPSPGSQLIASLIKLPARTYVLGRDTDPAISTIILQDGSGLSWLVDSVWDVAYGFSNEYRACMGRRQGRLPV